MPAQFPVQVWDGLSDNWQRVVGAYEAPNADDWNQIVMELQATQTAVKSGITAGETNISCNTVTTTGNITVGGNLLLGASSVLEINSKQVIGPQVALVATCTITATVGSLPTPNGTTAIANTATPTVVELLDCIVELKAKFDALLAAVKTHGLVASS